MRALLLILALAVPVQDSTPADLIRNLEDDNVEVREQAQKRLTALGEAALPLLKETAESPRSSGELKLRASAVLKAIELNAKLQKAFKEPRRVTLKAEGTMLREILDETARQVEVTIDTSAVDGAAKVTLSAESLPLFQVLDLLCKDQAERSWEALDDGNIRFLKERHAAMPAEYGGPFRVRVQSLNVERNTDFKGKTATATVTLQADWDRRLKPSKIVEIDVTKVSDGQNSPLEVSAADAGVVVVRGVPGAQLRFNGMVFPEAGENNRAFTLRNLSPLATQIEMEGVARFTFPLEYREIRFDKPGTVESRDLGDTTVKLARGGSTEIWTLSFHKNPSATTPSWSRMISQRFDPDSFVVVDMDGNEFTGMMRAPNVRGRQFDAAAEVGVWYQAVIPRNPSNAIKEVRFRFVDQTLVKSLPFKFTSLPLP
jgi:hypothetical protein